MDNLLNDVPEDQTFILANGKNIRNLFELRECLSEIDNDTFSHHVNDNKNDFENWINNSVGDTVLAKRISGIKRLDEMFKIVHDRIEELKKSKTTFVKESKQIVAKEKKILPEKIENINKSEYWNGIIDFALGVAVGFAIALLVKSLV